MKELNLIPEALLDLASGLKDLKIKVLDEQSEFQYSAQKRKDSIINRIDDFSDLVDEAREEYETCLEDYNDALRLAGSYDDDSYSDVQEIVCLRREEMNKAKKYYEKLRSVRRKANNKYEEFLSLHVRTLKAIDHSSTEFSIITSESIKVLDKLYKLVMQSIRVIYSDNTSKFKSRNLDSSSIHVSDDMHIPSVKEGAFSNWFNSTSSEDFDRVWANESLRKKIEGRLRYPGGFHEWHLVSRANIFKSWGVTAEKITELRTSIDQVKFVNPSGVHGGLGSTKAHNELVTIIDNSTCYEDFKIGLRDWASKRLDGGINALPEGLK